MRPTRLLNQTAPAPARRGMLVALLLAAGLGAGAAAQGLPTLTILEPPQEARLAGPDVVVRLHAEGAIIGGRSRNGTHVLLRLDQLPPVKSYAEHFTFRGVEPGEHRLEAELRRTDDQPFDPPVVAVVSFRLVAPTRRAEP